MRHALLNLCRRHNKRQLHMTCTARVHIRFLFAYKYIYICSVSGFHTDSCMTRTMEGTSRNSHKKNITKVTNEIIKSMQFTHQSPLNTHCILHAVCYCYVGGIGERRRALWQTFKFAPPIVGGWWVMGDGWWRFQLSDIWVLNKYRFELFLLPFHTGCGVSFAFPNGTIHTGPATDYFRLQFRYTTI